MHVELLIRDSVLFLTDDFPEWNKEGLKRAPKPDNPSGTTLHLHFSAPDDVHTWWNKAVAAGAKVTTELKKQFWGDIYGQLLDPFGHPWSLAQKASEVESGSTAQSSSDSTSTSSDSNDSNEERSKKRQKTDT